MKGDDVLIFIPARAQVQGSQGTEEWEVNQFCNLRRKHFENISDGEFFRIIEAIRIFIKRLGVGKETKFEENFER